MLVPHFERVWVRPNAQPPPTPPHRDDCEPVYSTLPPTIVYSTFVPRIESGAVRMMSRDNTTTSASMPGASAPFSCSWNATYAPFTVCVLSACSRLSVCSGKNAESVPTTSRVTLQWNDAIGLIASTGTSVPLVTIAPVFHNDCHT